MFLQKKHLDSTTQEISQLKDQLTQLGSSLTQKQEENQKLFSALLEQLTHLQQNQTNFSQQFQSELQKISLLSQEFQSRVNSLKVFEDKAFKKIFEEADTEVKNQLQSLFKTTQSYRELESHLLDTKSRITLLHQEILKFAAIAQNLKPADFELSNYVKKVTQFDQEKLKLMQENETLKKLISHERRKSLNQPFRK